MRERVARAIGISSEVMYRMISARTIRVLLCLPLFLGACREKEPPRAAGVDEDAALRLTLASFNVRYEGPAEEPWREWPNRIHRVVKTVRGIDPDVLGVQEALHGQCADLRASMPDYAFTGAGRDDGREQGEYAAIFYRRDRFEADPADRGMFWLSDRPEQRIGEDAVHFVGQRVLFGRAIERQDHDPVVDRDADVVGQSCASLSRQ